MHIGGVMDPSIIAAGATGALGIAGQFIANDQNRKIAHEQMDFQERMSSTQYQRTVQDMIKAGLNPGLLFSKGAGMDSAPAGSAAQMQNPASGISSAARLLDMQNLKKQGNVLDAQTAAANAQAKNTEMDRILKQFQIPGAMAEHDIDLSDYGVRLRTLNRLLPTLGTGANVMNALPSLKSLIFGKGNPQLPRTVSPGTIDTLTGQVFK